jgi:YHS domain-containing protein
MVPQIHENTCGLGSIKLTSGFYAKSIIYLTFFIGNCIKGTDNYTVDYEDGKYLFSSKEDKDKFVENPENYAPQYGGFCAMAMTKGKDIRPNPKCFSIENGKLYFFPRIFFGLLNAKNQWLDDSENKRLSADKAWEKLNSKSYSFMLSKFWGFIFIPKSPI